MRWITIYNIQIQIYVGSDAHTQIRKPDATECMILKLKIILGLDFGESRLCQEVLKLISLGTQSNIYNRLQSAQAPSSFIMTRQLDISCTPSQGRY